MPWKILNLPMLLNTDSYRYRSVGYNGAEIMYFCLRKWVNEWVCGHINVILKPTKQILVASASPISGAKLSKVILLFQRKVLSAQEEFYCLP